ncbi:MAG: CapA family protein [Chloroflexi bacterium]|nr:CapA family protein [Chloroflexota bacterium]
MRRLIWLGLFVILAGCSAPRGLLPLPGLAQATPTPFQPLPVTPTPTRPPALDVWMPDYLPLPLWEGITAPPGSLPVLPAVSMAEADLRLTAGGEGETISRWVYALVTPFPTLTDGVSSEDVRATWSGGGGGAFAGRPLLMDASTLGMFTALWGAPAEGAVSVMAAAELLDYAWNHQPAWAILPFEALEPRWKTLEVDGQSPLRKEFAADTYALAVPVTLEGTPGALTAPPTNRDASRLTTVALTGVTALVRATAYTMEGRGVLYPGKDVGEWLRQADITHVSNEVPFAQNCPYPNPTQPDVRFCSDTRYIGLLEDVGVDIVELTGDHFQDWGAEAMRYTLELYRERGWQYYGGGEDLADGRKAALMEHNGNRLAFIGCNGKGGSFAQASANHPGAVTCDFDYMEAEIRRLRSEGYLPIATFQHYEYYTYQAMPLQERDFRRLAQAGAVVVSGSQAHQPQAFEFESGALIHYGLGNLFFDQYDVSQACRQGFIDRHVFYDGRYLGADLLTILFVDYARPRPMNAGEREDVLRAVFRASGW